MSSGVRVIIKKAGGVSAITTEPMQARLPRKVKFVSRWPTQVSISPISSCGSGSTSLVPRSRSRRATKSAAWSMRLEKAFGLEVGQKWWLPCETERVQFRPLAC